MSLTLPKPAGIVRARLDRALEGFIPEADRDEAIVSIVRTLEEVGIPIQSHGWLDDDEPLSSAFREEGLDSEGMPIDEQDDGQTVFLDVENTGDLPSRWDGDFLPE